MEPLMLIRKLRLHIVTDAGNYGFECAFSPRLTIVRGGNSSGKSTLFATLLYSLGMEELVGGRNEKALNYALTEHLNDGDDEIPVRRSETWIELENSQGEVITLRRTIRDDRRDAKLIEVFHCAHLTASEVPLAPTPTYVHDPHSAQVSQGFYRFFEQFLGLELPKVASTTGGDTKLYLQTIFAAHAIEQKRGWTDYIANIPYYGIREARTRVAEFVLGLNVFATAAERNRLNSESSTIASEWQVLLDELRREALSASIAVTGAPATPSPTFETDHLQLSKVIDGDAIPVRDYLTRMTAQLSELQRAETAEDKASDATLLAQLQLADDRVAHLASLYEQASTAVALDRQTVMELEGLLAEAENSLRDNRTTQKLRGLGAEVGMQLAHGLCPTCDQTVPDSLVPEIIAGPQMDIETNIGHLQAQVRMLTRHIDGYRDTIRYAEAGAADVGRQLSVEREFAAATRRDLGTTAIHSRAVVRRMVNAELEIERVARQTEVISAVGDRMVLLAKRLAANREARKNLPRAQYSEQDLQRISYFTKMFRSYVGSFGYESVANIAEISIAQDNLMPTLAQLELREIVQRRTADLDKASSASDFVRLIWAYLLSLYETSARPDAPGHHLGLLILDEPGQHSMRDTSQHELFLRLGNMQGLQSIVAASFDESEAVFRAATDKVSYALIRWDGKLIKRVAA
jgi:hypothetical protein